jgi:hydroxymethylpyrimidine/phosphomethylpyrimidine kinase
VDCGYRFSSVVSGIMVAKPDLLPRALTIAGFDPSGGAGVLADARTFAAFGFHASAAITSITFQNPARVFGALNQTDQSVRAQVLPLLGSYTFVCAKTGMLPTSEVVREVARLFRESNLPAPVVDPVLLSSSGQKLMEEDAIPVLIKELFSLARVITPNIPEAEQLTGELITSELEMRHAAARMREMGARAVLVKGGHLKRQVAGGRRQEVEGRRQEADDSRQEKETSHDDFAIKREAIDLLDNEGTITVFRGEFVQGGELHGSGCILSSAIAAGLGKGMTLENSVDAAKKFVLKAIQTSLVYRGN